ncbi:MAG: tetratricopeptide repeat protein [Phenylobacterium sp.]|jgi:hypothetical protein|uniref:tetratricopeptide repeat protein n=1 Tax=Phenylobacterium sp. TaxID=1871053 RepID=UPI00391B89C0
MLGIALAAAAALNCNDNDAIYEAWTPAFAAYEAQRFDEAKTLLDGLIATCPSTPILPYAQTMRAEIALYEEDYDSALKALEDVQRPQSGSLGPLPNFIALRSLAAKEDAEGYDLEARRLFHAVELRLTDPMGPVKAKLVERFSVGKFEVTAIEGDYKNGSFIRKMTFLIKSSEPFAPLETVMLTQNPTVDLIGSSPRKYFVDQYTCNRHVTVTLTPTNVTYKQVRATVEGWLAGRQDGVSATEAGGVCAFKNYVAPGWSSD